MTEGRDLPDLPPREGTPWVETRAGGLFFINAVVAAPVLMLVYALGLRFLLRDLMGLAVPAGILDPIPLVAAYVAPVLGWLTIPAGALVVWNLRMVDRRWPRLGLWTFLAAHAGVLAYTVARLLG